MNSSNPAKRLVVLDATTASIPAGRCVAHWTLREAAGATVSVPVLVDDIAHELRAEYVAWTHDLGATMVNGRSVRAHMLFWPDFSFWWMGLIPEKEPLRTGSVYTVFKLRALERLYVERGCEGILYVGRDRALAATFRDWGRTLGHPYECVKAGDQRVVSRHPILFRLPAMVQGIGYLLWKCWQRYRHTAGVARHAKKLTRDQATIITFFPNIDLQRTQAGHFWSRYWERLHDLLDSLPVAVNWVWLYVDSEQASFSEAVRLRELCNRTRPGKYRYVLLDDFVTARVVMRALRTYLRSCAMSVRLREVRGAFQFSGSSLNFFPILSRDWRGSLCGLTAMDGALTIELFEEAARGIGSCLWTLFVWENQPWEHAAVAAWRRHANGRIVGVQHATLPALDLRAFIDPREAEVPVDERRPLPDLIAVNGRGAHDRLREGGFAEERLVLTEALRYIHPGDRRGICTIRPTLLVITGFRRSETRHQLALLDEAGGHGALAGYRRVVVKPHPLCMVEPLILELKASFSHEVVKEPLASLWTDVDAVFAANSTSAVTEALAVGLPAAVCAPRDEMNLSPAFGIPGVPMIATARQLEAFLRSPRPVPWPSDYFLLDEGLPRWRQLLDVHA